MTNLDLPIHAVSTSLRVLYTDTDAMGIAYHANYLPWLEVGRDEYLRANGYSYRDMESSGVNFLVVETRVRFRAPARYDDPIVIITWLKSMDNNGSVFMFKVRNDATGQDIVEAETKYAFANHVGEPVDIEDYPVVWRRIQNALRTAVS